MSVNRNLAASAVGNAWTALVQIAFVPVYLKLLGVEAYGLIGVYTFLQASLVFLDLGLGGAVSREAARAAAGALSVGEVRRLVRSAEVVLAIVALALAVSIAAATPAIVTRWLQIDGLPDSSAAHALRLMGVLVGLRLLVGLHRGVLAGHQRIVWLQAAGAGFATARAAGVIAALVLVAPTIEVFFVFQCGVTLLEAVVFARKAWSLLPSAQRAAFSLESLDRVKRFSGGIAVVSALYLVLSQADKVLLSTLLPLASFAYYALAASVAGALALLIAPIGPVAYPRLTELAARHDDAGLAADFHRFAWLAALAVAPAALVLAVHAGPVLALWTGDPAATAASAPLLALLAIGTMLNAFMSTPCMVAVARGSTRGLIALNLAFVAIFLPAICYGVSRHGAAAAAWAWIGINVVGVVLMLPLLHAHLPAREKWTWVVRDVAAPALAALAGCLLATAMLPGGDGWIGALTVLLAYLAALGAAAATFRLSGARATTPRDR